jgi:AraC-like DNA-binding protein
MYGSKMWMSAAVAGLVSESIQSGLASAGSLRGLAVGVARLTGAGALSWRSARGRVNGTGDTFIHFVHNLHKWREAEDHRGARPTATLLRRVVFRDASRRSGPDAIPVLEQEPWRMVTLDQAGRGARQTRIIEADPRLDRFVELLWLQAPAGADRGARAWRIIADASAHLIVSRDRDPRGRPRTRVSVVGARTRWVDADITRREWVAGVRLRKGVLPLLTRLPASDFTNRTVPARDVFGSAGAGLRERLEAVAGPAEVARVVSAFLADELAGCPAPDPRIDAGAGQSRHPAARRVRELAARAGTGERSLRRLYADGVGLSPVCTLRIERMHRALALALAGAGGWARIAARSGYSDQSHMIHEFRTLLGETPRRFVGRRSAPA